MDRIRYLECWILRAAHEINLWKGRFMELETQFSSLKGVELQKLELERALEVCLANYNGLAVEFRKKKNECVVVEDRLNDLMIARVDVEDELEEYKRKCEGLKERITRLEEDQKVMCTREKKAQERINHLSKELKKRGSEEIETYVCQLKTENKNLECGKRSAEVEIEVLKKRFGELESHTLRLKQVELEKNELQKELEASKFQCHGLCVELEEKKMQCVGIQVKLKDQQLRKIAVDDELKEYKTRCNEMKEWIMGLEEDKKVISKKEKSAQERISYLEEEIRKMKSEKRRAQDEIEIWNKRYKELETQFLSMKQVESEKVELEKGLEEYRTKCNGLSVELEESKMECVVIEGKLKDLLLTKIVVDDELKEYKTTCNRLKEQIMDLEEDQKVICKKEKRAQERITYLEAEIKSIKYHERDKYVDLRIENQDLECKKISAENEIKIWMKRCSDLETGILVGMKQVELEKAEVEQEFEILLTKYDELSMELNKKKMKCVAVEDDAHLPHLKIEEKMLSNSAFESCNYVAGPPSISIQSEPLLNSMEEKMNSDLESKVNFGSRVKKQQVFKFERISSEKLPKLEKSSVRTAFGGIVKIGDGDDEIKIAPEHTCHLRGKKNCSCFN